MKIYRDSFEEYFTKENLPHWICSTCKIGILEIDFTKFQVFETKESEQSRSDRGWNITHVSRFYIGLINCNNKKCKEVYSTAGTVSIEILGGKRKLPVEEEQFYPHYFYPILNLFILPEETPFEVEESIVNSFSLFWIDKSACGNAIRTCLEVILDDKKIPKTQLSSNSKRRLKRNLNSRIDYFKDLNPDVSEKLMAAKWIGNESSHNSLIDNEDLLDGFQLLKYVLEKLYSTTDRDITKIARNINKRKKP